MQRDDAWRTWLVDHGRQRDESLPGPFVTSVSRVRMSPTQAMEGGLSAPSLGTEEARTAKPDFNDFPAPEMEPESAHVASAVSVP